ncbi:13307_t:CDS:2 [Dentiscutata erythropus]|uniref:13307_t:CDS:1 n=1 Tax=Dentiscutata erythropus TaxID=1348616 RepID=A0A9N9NKY2_9GLOM|nr:13307_t:CDS:2 [Dentiscutata erythropus]
MCIIATIISTMKNITSIIPFAIKESTYFCQASVSFAFPLNNVIKTKVRFAKRQN